MRRLFNTALSALSLIVILAAASPRAFAQWPAYPTANAPRTPDGKPALDGPTPRMPDGKPDLSGIWGLRGGGGGGGGGGQRAGGNNAQNAPAAGARGQRGGQGAQGAPAPPPGGGQRRVV